MRTNKLYLCRLKWMTALIICFIPLGNLWLAVTKIWIHISNTNNKVQSTCKYYTNKDIQIWKLKKLQVNNGRVSSLASSSVTTYGLQSHTATQGIAVKIRMRYGHSKSYHLVTVRVQLIGILKQLTTCSKYWLQIWFYRISVTLAYIVYSGCHTLQCTSVLCFELTITMFCALNADMIYNVCNAFWFI